MVFHGHVRNGVVVLDAPARLPEGASVRVEVIADDESHPAPRQGGQWKGQVSISSDFDELPEDIAEAFGARPS